MYQAGDKIVHPMHGAGVIDEIVERTIDGETESYYAMRLGLDRVVLYIPVRTSDSIGVRPVCTAEAAEELLAKLPGLKSDATVKWNHRYRENMEHLRSGDLLEVAGVIKALTLRDRRRSLSTGEKRILDLSKQILASELALALGRDPEEMKREVVDLLCPRRSARTAGGSAHTAGGPAQTAGGPARMAPGACAAGGPTRTAPEALPLDSAPARRAPEGHGPSGLPFSPAGGTGDEP